MNEWEFKNGDVSIISTSDNCLNCLSQIFFQALSCSRFLEQRRNQRNRVFFMVLQKYLNEYVRNECVALDWFYVYVKKMTSKNERQGTNHVLSMAWSAIFTSKVTFSFQNSEFVWHRQSVHYQHNISSKISGQHSIYWYCSWGHNFISLVQYNSLKNLLKIIKTNLWFGFQISRKSSVMLRITFKFIRMLLWLKFPVLLIFNQFQAKQKKFLLSLILFLKFSNGIMNNVNVL